jgi:hypothetical protein
VISLSGRLLAELAVAAVLIAAFIWYRQHLIDEGEARIRAADARVVAAQREANALKDAQSKATVAAEKAAYVEKISAPVANPVPVRLCHDAPRRRAVPEAPAAGPPADAGTELRAGPPRDPAAGPDIGPDLIRNDRRADAQIEGLQHYILNVCLKQ